MKTHLRVTHDDDDDYIDTLIVAARVFIETQYDMAINTQTITEYFDEWDDQFLVLTVTPAQSITSIKYYDEDNNIQTLSSDNYIADTVSRYGRIQFKPDAEAPTLYARPNAIEVAYLAGNDATAPNVEHAIKLIVGDWYASRERMPGNVRSRLLDTVQTLLNVYK